MPNTFAFVTGWLAMRSLRTLINKLEVAPFFNTDYNKEFTKPFAVGESALVKFPQRFLIRDGLQYQEQGLNRRSTNVTCNQVFGIDFQWDSVEQALKMERGEEAIAVEYIDPAMEQIAQEIDSRAALYAYQNTNNITGVLGTTPTAMSTYNRARTLMVENGCPPGPRGMIITPQMNENAVVANAALFNPTDEIAMEFKKGYVGGYAGSEWYESMSLYQHTAGTWAGAVTLSASVADGATSLALTCTTGDTFNQGDVIGVGTTGAGTLCYNVNPSTRRTTGRGKTFVITQDTVGVGSAATIQISPAIYGPGNQYQNVDALPASGTALVLFPGTSSPNGKIGASGLNLHRDAFAMVGVPMEKPEAVELSWQRRDPKTGITVRFVRAWDQSKSMMTNRFDVLLGFGTLYNDNAAVRVLSGQ